MPPATLEQFLHHPLFAVVEEEDPPQWVTHPDVPDRALYRHVRPQFPATVSLAQALQLVSNAGANMLRWIIRRGVCVRHAECTLLDLERRELYNVDMVGERGDELTLMLVYSSPRRGGQAWELMLRHGQAIRALAARQYRLEAEVVVINLYGQGLVRGAWLAP